MKKRRISILTVLLTVCAATMAQGLKDAYKDYFLIGVAVNQRNVTNAEQQALIKREFSSMTAENDMKPEPTEPRQGQFNWEGADRIANFARQVAYLHACRPEDGRQECTQAQTNLRELRLA